MLTGIESTRTEELRHQQMLSGLKTFDSDNQKGLSLSELEQYKADNNNQIPEFAQKLIEKFEQLDADKNGQLQSHEVNALHNNRGLWQIDNVQALPIEQTASLTGSTEATAEKTDAKEDLIKKLLKEGYEQLKDKVDIKEIIDKVI